MGERQKFIIEPIGNDEIKAVSRILPIELPPRVEAGDMIPEELAIIIAEDLRTLVEQAGLDPENVVFSGYSKDGHDTKSDGDFGAEGLIDQYRLAKSYAAREYNSLLAQKKRGETVDVSVMKSLRKLYEENQAIIEYAQSRRNEPIAGYYFGPLDMEAGYGRDGGNPLSYSEVGGAIGVYDKSKLKALAESYGTDFDDFVIATPDEIADALIIEYVPRFEVI